MTVEELTPGDRIRQDGVPLIGTFIQQTRHPLYPHLRLVIWVLSDGTTSLDALSPMQYIGSRLSDPENHRSRQYWLRQALQGRGQAGGDR